MDIMGYPNQCMDTRIKPLRDDMKVAGPAFTMWGMREPLFGDCDGVIVIPQDILTETLEKTEDLTERENLSRKALAEGMLLPDVVKKYGRA